MKIFNKFFLITILVALGIGVVAARAAVSDPYGYKQVANQAELQKTIAGASDIPSAVGVVVAGALAFIGIIFFVLVLWAGFIWMTARGDTAKIDKSKNILEGAIVGILLVSAAYAIANFIFGTVVGSSGCTQQGGTCMDVTQCNAMPGYAPLSGFCGGGDTNQCCLPKTGK